MPNFALLIEYDGAAYGGWQIQKNSNSIQGTIEKTLSRLLQEDVKIIGAGRTDAGVHARGQVANFRSGREWTPDKLMYALNGTLPEDIAIRAAAMVPDDFHARYSAVSRRYSYRVISRKTAIARDYSAFIPFELSVDAMNTAARCLVGERNFKSFTKYADEQRSFICNVTKAKWTSDGERTEEKGGVGDGEKGGQGESCLPRAAKSQALPFPPVPRSHSLLFEIEANRFLHGMVRAIVGTLVDVGRGKLTVKEFEEILESRDRKAASMSAPACGLFLEEVGYGWDLWAGTM